MFLPTIASRRSQGFTLVELLVVIAVVAILASLLLAGLASANATARLAVCRNNIRQINLALVFYASETEYYPSSSREGAWITKLLPGLRMEATGYSFGNSNLALSNTVFSCPGFNRMPGTYDSDFSVPFSINWWGARTSHQFRTDQRSRGLGGNGSNKRGEEDIYQPVRESQVVNPSQMISLGDATIMAPNRHSNIDPPFVAGTLMFLPAEHPGDSSAVNYYARRHRARRWNMAFTDGHVETLRLSALDLTIPESRRRLNRDNQPH